MMPVYDDDAPLAGAGDGAPILRVVPPNGVVAGPAAPPMSEIGLSDLWVRRYGDDWRYVAGRDVWLEWRGDGWFVDATGAVRESVAAMLREAQNWPDASWMSQSQMRALCGAKTVAGVIAMAQIHREIATAADLWDADPMTLGVPGGIVDLTTGEFSAASKTDYVTMRTAVAPEPGVPVMWLAHLVTVYQADMQLIKHLQAWIGYCLTGHIVEHKMLFAIGKGGNGKSATFDTIISLLSDYAYAAPVNMLTESFGERHPTELAALRGKRFVLCSEPPEGAKWDDGRIRSLTGDATITARSMRQDFTTFRATHKLTVMGNHKPQLRSVDDAIRRRMQLVDFAYKIQDAEKDPMFLENMRAEWPRILTWAIQGCLEWQDTGLPKPDALVQATAQYLEDQDEFNQFLSECCDREPAKFDLVSVIWKRYQTWCEKESARPMQRKSFKSALLGLAGVERKGSAGDSVSGIAVKRMAAADDLPEWQR